MVSDQGGGSHLHRVAGRMLGIEANSYELACLVAQIKTEVSKRPFASCAWVCPGSRHLTGLMFNVVPSHMCDERAHLSSMSLEPPVGSDMKPDIPDEQYKESS